MRRLIWLLPVILLFAVAACGDDDNGDDVGDNGDNGATTPEATAPAENGDDATTPEPEPAGDTDPTPEAANGDEVDLEELGSRFANMETASFSVTWDMQAEMMGESMSGTWTWIQDAGSERTRMDMDVDVAEMPGVVTIISSTDETLMCMDQQCMSMPGGESMFGDPSAGLADQVEDLDDQVLGGNVTDAGTRDIAGVTAHCFEFEEGEQGESGTVCISDQGVPLSMQSEGAEGTMMMEATSYSDSVSDSDFEPPYDVMEMDLP